MQPLLGVEDYSSLECFDAERLAIFRRLWLLAAITPMLSAHLDYRTIDIAGVPLVLQNHSGTIRAFANICRHRMARVQEGEFGNRPLVCRYHHWSYDAAGGLQHTHKDPGVFGFTAEEKADIRLREFSVTILGALVFVNLSDDPLPIEEQFDAKLMSAMASATSRMDSTFIHTNLDTAFNWKIGMENIKDGLHVSCLHKETYPEYFDVDVVAALPPAASPGFPSSEEPSRGHLMAASMMTDVVINGAPPVDWQNLVEHLESKNRYRAFQLFPNVNLMIVDGTSFAIQIYHPLAADKTRIEMMVALTKPVAEFPHKPVVLWEHLVSDMRVLQEDVDCLERLQSNFKPGRDGVIHGRYETLILDFQAACLKQLQAGGRRDGPAIYRTAGDATG